MSFGNILSQILQDGLGQGSQTRSRVDTASRNLGSAGGGIDGIFGQIQDALGRAGIDTAGASQAAGGFADKARDFLQKDQIGGMSGAQIGGIGAVAGALLGGGLGGAARGGAMAVLGTLALGALKAAQARNQGMGAAPADLGADIDTGEVKSLVSPDGEKLALRAMISAAKADGQIDRDEMQKIVGKISPDSVTEDEKRFVLEEMQAPIDIPGLAAQARTPAQAAGVYAASLLAIHVDSNEERRYLADLAQALRLDGGTVAELHRMTGAPVA